MAFGDHIFVSRFRGVYTHHGIDCGDGWVIHYNGPTPLHCVVRRATWEEFGGGDPISVRPYAATERPHEPRGAWEFLGSRQLQRLLDACTGRLLGDDVDTSREAVVARAESRLGEGGFDFLFNNCEHFATWCKTGLSTSRQIESLWSALAEPHRSLLPRATQVGLA
ncbi:MAG: lecithin retinol acyltransferase family protein [Deltaproteobacteria bacterium]|nr:lecithin retinol acyltransferase family protein [Deltaproteobacteria bacterium]MBW2359505.1 lecithin retinol acyltransferase family protein [Deltaproteobacteria bacterium]